MTKKSTAALVPAQEHLAPVASEEAAIFSMVERIMADPSVSIERIEQTWGFYLKVQAEKARKEFAVALIAAQAEMMPVRKDMHNKQTNSRYASFEALDSAIRPIYTKHGFGITHHVEPSDKPEHIKAVLTLMHAGGHERRYEFDMPADGKGAKGGDAMTKTHAAGSAFSYGKRYNLGGAFNLTVTKDDDGNAAGGSKPAAAPSSVDDRKIMEVLIAETKADRGWLCGHYCVETLDDLTKDQVADCVAKLNARKRQQAGAK